MPDTVEAEIIVLGELIDAMNQLGDDAATRERVLRYLLARYWPKGVERIVFIGKDNKTTSVAEGGGQ